MNGDNWPDLFVSHHRNRPSLYVNLANRTFEDRAFEVDEWFVTPRSDTHGGTFADYDNDGDADLVITAGSKNNSQFLINNGAYLTDRIEDFTFDEKSWGGRLPIWFDFSHDGLLDLGIAVPGRPQGAAARAGERRLRSAGTRHPATIVSTTTIRSSAT